jgi:hypothetical protein
MRMNRVKRIARTVGLLLCIAVFGFAFWGEALLSTNHVLLEKSWLRNVCIGASCIVFVLTILGFAYDIRNKRQKLKRYE